uniref:Secreted protein n=1 Tax=Glossina pallidipes TaxID=7398 RepID=A0A1A9Z1D8_GLOPL
MQMGKCGLLVTFCASVLVSCCDFPTSHRAFDNEFGSKLNSFQKSIPKDASCTESGGTWNIILYVILRHFILLRTINVVCKRYGNTDIFTCQGSVSSLIFLGKTSMVAHTFFLLLFQFSPSPLCTLFPKHPRLLL